MAVQERNGEMVQLLSADFLRNKLPLYLHDGVLAGQADIAVNDQGATATTIIPDQATIDVKQLLRFEAIVKPSTGSADTVEGSVAVSGSVSLYSSGVNILTLAVAASGAVTLQRTGGALTYDVRLRLEWI